MKKIQHGLSKTTAKRRKASVKRKVLKCKTAAGIVYTVSYPAPRKSKGYQPNASSQFGAPDVGSFVCAASGI